VDAGEPAAGEQVIAADDTEILRVDRAGMPKHRQQQLPRRPGILSVADKIRECGSCGPDLVEHELLLAAAAEPAEFADELADRAGAAVLLIARDMRRHVADEALGIVPIGRGRIAGQPFPPAGVRSGGIDQGLAVPLDPEREMRVEPGEALGDLCKTRFLPFPGLSNLNPARRG
jgi:hypothetical protein